MSVKMTTLMDGPRQRQHDTVDDAADNAGTCDDGVDDGDDSADDNDSVHLFPNAPHRFAFAPDPCDLGRCLPVWGTS